jgi:hypothetical protein
LAGMSPSALGIFSEGVGGLVAEGSVWILGAGGRDDGSGGAGAGAACTGGGVNTAGDFRNQHEDKASGSTNAAICGLGLRMPHCSRELQSERNAASRLAGERDSTIMQLNRPECHRQTDAGTTGLGSEIQLKDFIF